MTAKGSLAVGVKLKRILIVEDDALLREFMATAVRQHGFEPDEASNGGEAIEKLEGQRYDGLVLDLIMPARNGFEVIAFMRDRRIAIPCIVITGAGPSVSPLVDRSIVTEVLQKPFGLRKLLETVDRAFEHPA